MKCPYKNFTDCLIEQCPSCNFEKIETTCIEGRYPNYLDTEEAIKRGCAWESIRTSYRFISCKLIDNNVQPIPSKNEVININNKTSVTIRRSLF